MTNWDINLFYFLTSFHSNFLDNLMLFFSSFNYWKIPIIIVLLGLLILGRRKEREFVIVLFATFFISDGISHLLKILISSPRPYNFLQGVKVLVEKTSSSGFPSNHASNTFSLAVLTFFYYKKFWWILLTFAIIVSFSRIYVGAHFPSDVIGGACIGSLIGWGMGKIRKS